MNISDLIELRVSSRPELGNLYWPKYDRGCWSYMHQYPLGQEFFDALMSHVSDRSIMVQAGGNCGQYVRQYANLFDTVYTFEPDPLNFVCLTLNCPTNVIKTQACVGNNKDFVALTPYRSRGAKSDDAGGIHVGGKGVVPTVIIDELNLPSCGLIQLDVEGYEYFALMGAQKTIEKYHPVIIVEWYGPWAARYNVNQEQFDKFFIDMGYSQVIESDTDQVYIYNP